MKRALVVVAHPDDETLFFGGTIASHPEVLWEVACVTDGGRRASERALELERAATLLGVSKVHHLGFADDPGQRLSVEAVSRALSTLGEFDEVYTHGPLGDYGHPHHQDVCLAVHRVFGQVWSVARGVLPERWVPLSAQAFEVKSEIMATVYAAEHRSFLLVLPVTPLEGFVRVSLREVEVLHALLSGGRAGSLDPVVVHRKLLPMIEEGAVKSSARAFFSAYF